MKAVSIMLGVLLLALMRPATALDSMRCGSRLASAGMTAAEVLAACGEPDYRDVWAQPAGYGAAYLGQVEEWTYNFGSNQLLRVLRFRQGRLQRIDTEGYGFAADAVADCSGGISIGISKYRLLAECGEPVTRSADFLQVPVDRGRRVDDPRDAAPAWAFVYREEWVYNFGAGRLMRIVQLDNGRVSEVQTGARGFDRERRR